MRDHAYRRAVRSKWINRRLFIVKNVWGYGHPDSSAWITNLSKYDSNNLTCRPRCGLCHPWKRWPNKTWNAKHPATRHASLAQLDSARCS